MTTPPAPTREEPTMNKLMTTREIVQADIAKIRKIAHSVRDFGTQDDYANGLEAVAAAMENIMPAAKTDNKPGAEPAPWSCKCGYLNIGPVCTKCAKAQPAADESDKTRLAHILKHGLVVDGKRHAQPADDKFDAKKWAEKFVTPAEVNAKWVNFNEVIHGVVSEIAVLEGGDFSVHNVRVWLTDLLQSAHSAGRAEGRPRPTKDEWSGFLDAHNALVAAYQYEQAARFRDARIRLFGGDGFKYPEPTP